MDGQCGLFSWSLFIKLSVSAGDLFRQCLTVHLFSSPSINAIFGAYITPHISSNWLGFISGMIFVVGIAIILYEIHLRIPLLKFLFSGKPAMKRDNSNAVAR